jgi:hypothetical protein
VKRAKLYYLRDRTGKSARIADRDRGNEADQYALADVVEEIIESKVADTPTEVAEDAVEEKAEQSNVDKKSESSASEAENTDDTKK